MAVQRAENMEFRCLKYRSARADESKETSDLKNNTRQAWLNLILRTRESSPELKKSIEAINIYICERHFKPECILTYPKRKVLVTGSIPTENLPTKSHDKVTASVADTPSTSSSDVSPTLTLEDLQKYMIGKHILPWTVKARSEEGTKFEYYDESHSIPKFTIGVNERLEFTAYVYNWPIPDNHSIYQLEGKKCLKTLDDAIEMLKLVTNSNLCEGLPQDLDVVTTVAVDPTWNEKLSHFTQSTVI
ncbi:Transposable element P transposase [Paramuricea clavata]|uniref:Transposable element P transposase n=1 Tax=Paramuricea clavata TaxID=317549 RepID=A0A6S7I557_PARCT|nr:Transposable element P transposase [Paramuricea clavata]